jgi:hypothetical protein
MALLPVIICVGFAGARPSFWAPLIFVYMN